MSRLACACALLLIGCNKGDSVKELPPPVPVIPIAKQPTPEPSPTAEQIAVQREVDRLKLLIADADAKIENGEKSIARSKQSLEDAKRNHARAVKFFKGLARDDERDLYEPNVARTKAAVDRLQKAIENFQNGVRKLRESRDNMARMVEKYEAK